MAFRSQATGWLCVFLFFFLNDTELSSIPLQGLCILSLLITVDIGQLRNGL